MSDARPRPHIPTDACGPYNSCAHILTHLTLRLAPFKTRTPCSQHPHCRYTQTSPPSTHICPSTPTMPLPTYAQAHPLCRCPHMPMFVHICLCPHMYCTTPHVKHPPNGPSSQINIWPFQTPRTSAGRRRHTASLGSSIPGWPPETLCNTPRASLTSPCALRQRHEKRTSMWDRQQIFCNQGEIDISVHACTIDQLSSACFQLDQNFKLTLLSGAFSTSTLPSWLVLVSEGACKNGSIAPCI